ncbi:MAG: FtsW/RodA/SpoVE family cell cycle protein [bacterium]
MTENRIDRKFLVLLGLLLLLGLVMLVSASGPISFQKFGDPYWYVRHQLFFGLLPGIVMFFLLSHVDYRALRRLARPAFYVSVLLLLLVFVPGVGADWGTSHSWINLGGFSFQPAELVKLTILLYLADAFADVMPDEMHDVHRGLLPFLFALLPVSALIVLQPDLGSLIAIAALSGLTFLLAGAPWSHLAGLSGVGLLALWLLVKLKPYRANRLMAFLHPELDPQGIGYHINQAFLAIGSGGLFGLGLGHSRQKYMYLPEVIGDSIFAVMSEELGYVVMLVVLGLMAAFLLRLMSLAKAMPDRFGRLLVGGIACWVFAQVILNVGSMIGLFPMTGLPLPFVSYGGTALMVLLAAMGVVANASRQVGGSVRSVNNVRTRI